MDKYLRDLYRIWDNNNCKSAPLRKNHSVNNWIHPYKKSTSDHGLSSSASSSDLSFSAPSTPIVSNFSPNLNAVVPIKIPQASYNFSSTLETPSSLPTSTIRARIQNKKKFKARANLSKSAVLILKEWLMNHVDNPYPEEDEKDKLAFKAKISSAQLSNWFINARRRLLARSVDNEGKRSFALQDIPGY